MKPAAGVILVVMSCTLGACRLASAADRSIALSPTFTDIGAGLTGLNGAGATAWGDYDADGDLDIAVAGPTTVGPIARIYRNTAGVFADASALPMNAAVSDAALAWGDYDKDGDLDLAIAGNTGTSLVTRIYRNIAGVFTDIAASLFGVRNGAVAWADYDNDGDLDLTVAGDSASILTTRVYRNTAGSFADAAASLTGCLLPALAWADYDLDHDLDLVVSGRMSPTADSTKLYRNTGGTLGAVPTGLTRVRDGAMDWSDFDNDGDPDLLMAGQGPMAGVAQVWRNTGGSFVNSGAVLQGSYRCATVWGDYDNDGLPDIAVMGTTGSIGFGAVYHSNGGSFTDINAALPRLASGSCDWGDYDNDGDIDLLIAGPDDQGVDIPCHRIYRLSGVASNTPPTAPINLSALSSETMITFSWSAATDAETPAAGLTYNLWAGSAPGTHDVMSPMASLANGFRRVPKAGNVGQNFAWSLARSAFPGNQVYWGVQAIDHAFAGSAFATGTPALLGVGDEPVPPRSGLRLTGANPSGAESRIAYSLAVTQTVDLAILDVTGRRVVTLDQGERMTGDHEVRWDGRDGTGARSAPGLYFASLRAGGETESTKVLRVD